MQRTAPTALPPQPFALPRTLIFLAPMWLIGSWLLAMGLQQPLQPVSESYTPGVRMTLVCVMIGLVVAWPLFRLSQRAFERPLAQMLVDVASLAVLIQFVVWPLRIFTPWSLSRVWVIDLAMISWTALVGAIVGAAVSTNRAGPRLLAMIVSLMLCFLGPLLTWLSMGVGIRATNVMSISPIVQVLQLTDAGGGPVLPSHWNLVLLIAGCAVLVWLMLGLWRVGARLAASATPAAIIESDQTDSANP